MPSHGITNSYGINTVNQVENLTVTSAGATLATEAFVYDAVGNLTDDGAGKTFEWDAAYRVVAINYISTGNRTECAYDGLGRRVKITEYQPNVTAEAEPSDGNYANFSIGKFTLPAGTYTLTLQGLNPNGGNNTMLIDSVKLNNALMTNGSFEYPPGVSNYVLAPTGATWSFSGSAGIAANGGAFTSANPNTTDGNQVGFIGSHGTLSQSLYLSAGTYKLTFKAAQLGSGNDSSQRILVTFRSASSANIAKSFVWCGNTICEERDGTGANVTKRFFANGEQRIVEGHATNYFYTRDHLGSIREVTKADGGAMVAQYDYDPYGKRVTVTGEMDLEFGYAGYYYHAPSGLNLTLYRAYNPTLGRWLSRDPIGEAVGLNLYGYVANDPVSLWDSLGLDWRSDTIRNTAIIGGITGAIIGGAGGFGGGLFTGPAAVAASPTFSVVGGTAGAGIGTAAGAGVGAGLVSAVDWLSYAMSGGNWRDWLDPDKADECSSFEKNPQGDNTAKNDEFVEAMRKLGIDKGTDKWRRAHDAISGKRLNGARAIEDNLRELGF